MTEHVKAFQLNCLNVHVIVEVRILIKSTRKRQLVTMPFHLHWFWVGWPGFLFKQPQAGFVAPAHPHQQCKFWANVFSSKV
eukprot:2204866-Amphidinium_carterae.1